MNYLQFSFRPLASSQQEILVAQLAEIGFEGFEEAGDTLHAFIPETDFSEEALQQVLPAELEVTRKVVPPTNWNAEWEKDFEPVVVDDFVAIRANFHQPIDGVEHDIIITPKMSFGTGHHATTYMMIQFMHQLNFQDKEVLDFGTGTGVLAILADKLGATVTAFDNDDWSIENSKENIAVNNCNRTTLFKADTLDLNRQFDVILANINKNVLLANMANLRKHLKPGGVVIMSGLLSGDRKDIEASAVKEMLKVEEQKDRQNWIALMISGKP
ncbi:50S ribosomal protein L11 methyltransferase [Pseudoflavitalea sp. G-6-1-2]|uniref:50S ribosomal protein L11 methyltransferase n=1 Tax=Pseudoflavitalea sp. G-6-1-2 TaxID=2728841 RepID=UPI00146F2EAD|nr:50S ribosomal protein L11 methyltransferase [Pseudoflavitalea sp. G-6-1-2]NML21589.1 50S ribosomal protein L11 methyltransferase [Pseudoflavitalea sp. G-6-1-2]